MTYIILFLLPLTVAVGSFILTKTINWKEFAVQVVAQAILAGFCAGIVSCENTTDTEVWNSQVISKQQVMVSCSHSYSCNCYESCSGSGKDRSCSTICQTCYEHSYDYDWSVYTTSGETIEINRVDRQGLDMPPRWASVVKGEPVATTHRFTNYVKAAPGTLFKHQGGTEKYQSYLPVYPQAIYDYYQINRIVTVGFILPDRAAWNESLSLLNGQMGVARQVNMIVVLVKDLPQDFYYALEEAWIGGKKNDVIAVIGVDSEMHPKWTTVMAWATKEIFKIKLRDDIMDESTLTKEGVLQALATNVPAYYQHKKTAEFEYLKASITPSGFQYGLCLGLGFMLAIGLAIYFHYKDPFDYGDKPNSRRNFRRI